MITITFLDEINMHVAGLSPDQTEYIIERTKLTVPGSHMISSFKLGIWDGKESFFEPDGLCFSFMMDEILEALDEIDVDFNSIKIEDQRLAPDLPQDFVDETWLHTEMDFDLRDYQVKGINTAISDLKGIINASTSSGKSLISTGISKACDPFIKTLVLVPSKYLVDQMSKDYTKAGLNFVCLSDYKPKDRTKAIEGANHVITTYKMLLNERHQFEDQPWALLIDEAHNAFGEETASVFRTELRQCPIRIGFTGTVPKDKYKAKKIMCHIGGDRLVKVSPKEIIDRGLASKVNVHVVTTSHKDMESLSADREAWEWATEEDYLLNHAERIREIAEYIKSLPKKNTMILCHAQAGTNLSQYFDGRMIRDDTPNKTRTKWLDEFGESDGDYYLPCSFQTTGTGVSVDQVQRVVLLDVGKNETAILQSIGRGMRLDGKENECEIIDIHAKTKYSTRHSKERMKIYKREKFPFVEGGDVIELRGFEDDDELL